MNQNIAPLTTYEAMHKNNKSLHQINSLYQSGSIRPTYAMYIVIGKLVPRKYNKNMFMDWLRYQHQSHITVRSSWWPERKLCLRWQTKKYYCICSSSILADIIGSVVMACRSPGNCLTSEFSQNHVQSPSEHSWWQITCSGNAARGQSSFRLYFIQHAVLFNKFCHFLVVSAI